MKIVGVSLVILGWFFGILFITVPLVGGLDYFLSGQTDVWWSSYGHVIIFGVVLALLLLSIGNWLKQKARKEGKADA